MKRNFPHILLVSMIAFSLVSQSTSRAQGYGSPLTFQGLDHFTAQSAASRAKGGLVASQQGDVGLMFLNPATLQALQGLEISVGSLNQSSRLDQVQQYGPLSYYSNFSLLMEGLTDLIPTPAYDTINHNPRNGADTVQRPFDKFGANWTSTKDKSLPTQVFIAMPLTVNDLKFSVGLGVSGYADLDWFFQNNNVLSPSILTVVPLPTFIPKNNADSNSIPVQWFQYFQQRTGSIYGYGGALSFLPSEGIAVGVSGVVLAGSSNDKESRVERGRLRFYQSFFRAESVYYHVSKVGTSDYSGMEFTFSGMYAGRNIRAGFTVKPPTTITRKFQSQVTTDTTGSSLSTAVNGQDKMTIPWRGTLGLSLTLRQNITLGLEYELRAYASAQYQSPSKVKTRPWLSSNLFHVGVEFTPAPWLALRAGAREQAEIFEPVGNPEPGDPVRYTIFSIGAGTVVENFHISAVYEFSDIRYSDTWADAVSINTRQPRIFVADITYEIPW